MSWCRLIYLNTIKMICITKKRLMNMWLACENTFSIILLDLWNSIYDLDRKKIYCFCFIDVVGNLLRWAVRKIREQTISEMLFRRKMSSSDKCAHAFSIFLFIFFVILVFVGSRFLEMCVTELRASLKTSWSAKGAH